MYSLYKILFLILLDGNGLIKITIEADKYTKH